MGKPLRLLIDVSDYSGTVPEWTFFVNGTAPHNVLDAVTVDIFSGAVPAPSVLALFTLCGVACKRRK